MRAIIAFVLFYAVLSFSVNSLAACETLVGSCSFYSCERLDLECSKSHYLHRFAERQCERYLEAQPHFSERGQQWLKDVRECLQLQQIEAGVATCDHAEDVGWQSHVTCYERFDFCGLDPRDKKKIVKMARSTLRHPKSWRLAWHFRRCLITR